MVENIKHLHAELHVEGFRDSLNLIVLKDGEVEVGDTGTLNDVASGITSKIEARQRRKRRGARVINGYPQARRRRIAIGRPKSRIGRGGDGEAFRFNVIAGVSGISQTLASRSAESIRICKIIMTL